MARFFFNFLCSLADVPVSGGDWIHTMQNAMQPIQQEEANIQQNVGHNYAGNRFPDVLPMENHNPLDQSYQVL